MTNPAIAAVIGAAVVVVLTPACMALARRFDIVDRPGPLKRQQAPVPYLGGGAVCVALLPALGADRPFLVLPVVGALVLGVVDDVRGLPPLARLAGQAAVGAGIAASLPTRFAAPFGDVAVVAVTVLLVNGVNMIDGLDALAAGVLAAACTAWAVILGGPARAVAVAGAAAACAFLLYNRPPARVYLGDGGAYVLGTLSTILLASAWAPGGRVATGIAGLLPASVPAAEVAFAVLRRARAGHSVVAGDRRHPYDLLVAAGWHPGTAALAYVALAAALGTGALVAGVLHSVPGALVAAVAGGLCLLVLAARCGALRPEREVPR